MIRILVTGSRGKSTVVRMIHRALTASGIRAFGRITGVVPRTLTPHGQVPILRSSGVHVKEMAWWLRSLPADCQAVVMENSAVSQDLQPLAARWMKPSLTVFTNVRPDHQDAWGEGEEGASEALCAGVPKGGTVLLGGEMAESPMALALLQERRCRIVMAPLSFEGLLPSHMESNGALALEACALSSLDRGISRSAIASLPPDLADFSVLDLKEGKLAFAFSANDLTTTEELFLSLGWKKEDTTVVFNHRRDRPRRLRDFLPWLRDYPWKNRLIIGHRPLFQGGVAFCSVKDPSDMSALVRREGQVFGCGNAVYGVPLEFRTNLEMIH